MIATFISAEIKMLLIRTFVFLTIWIPAVGNPSPIAPKEISKKSQESPQPSGASISHSSSHQGRKKVKPALKLRLLPSQKLSNFTKLQALFGNAKKPSLLTFKKDAILKGRCTSKLKPGVWGTNILAVYHRLDPVLGPDVHFVLTLPVESKFVDREILRTSNSAIKFHDQNRAEIGNFTSLQEFSKPAENSEDLNKALENSLYFSKKPPHGVREPANKPPAPEYFRVRKSSNKSSADSVLMVEALCPHQAGCPCQETPCKEGASFLEPYLYCSFTKKYELSSVNSQRKKSADETKGK